VLGLDHVDGVDGEVGEELGLAAEDLRRERRLGDVEAHLAPEHGRLDRQVVLDELDRLLHRQSVARHDGGGMDGVLDELVGALEQLGGEDDDRRRAVAHLLVLHL